MKLHLSPYRRRLLIIAFCVVAIIVVWPWIMKGVHYLQAPKFSSIKYTGTEASYDCLAVITDATCTTKYIYQASGTESEIATGLKAELEKQGYILNPDSEVFNIVCHRGDGADQHSFVKQKEDMKGSAGLYVLFYPSKQTAPTDTSEFGCDNSSDSYRIEILSRT